MWWLWFLLLLPSFLILNIANSIIREHQFFKKRKIYHFGNGTILFWKNLYIRPKLFADITKEQYNDMKKAKVTIAGTTEMGKVVYTIKDLEVLKRIFVKDFDHFVNHKDIISPGTDELTRNMLIFVTDEKWKTLRSKMSPTFTTGKIKRMFQLFYASSKKLMKFVEQEMAASNEGEMNLQDAYSKFTMDTIASVVCGMDSQAFDQKEPSVFEQFAKKLQFNLKGFGLIRVILVFHFPKLAEMLNFTVFGRDTNNFFSEAIKEAIKRRKDNGEKPNDFIQLLLEAREGKLKLEESELNAFEKDALIKEKEEKVPGKIEELLDDDVIIANCALFILAGFDTTQSLLLFCAYSLATNPDIQETLREEIEQTLEENGGKFTYESLHKMAYLDMVINETLRFYPPTIHVDRGVTKDYQLQLPGNNSLMLKKGDGIIIPVLGIHHDPDVYENPEKFDPLRFSPENKGKIYPYAFLSFGQGPRNCIGMRFALTEVKLAIAQLVFNFNIEPSKKTLIPMVYDNVSSLKPKGGMWLALKKRN